MSIGSFTRRQKRRSRFFEPVSGYPCLAERSVVEESALSRVLGTTICVTCEMDLIVVLYRSKHCISDCVMVIELHLRD